MAMQSFIVRKMLQRQEGFFQKLEEFEKTQYFAPGELKNYQEAKLKSLIKHAYATVPFYRDLFDERKLKPDDIKGTADLGKLPVLEKEMLRGNYERLLSAGMRGTIHSKDTSGSTGVPLRIVTNSEASMIERLLYYRFLQWLGYEWGDSIVEFWGEHAIQSQLRKMKQNLGRIIYNMHHYSTYEIDNQRLAKIAASIHKRPPKILRGYTSSVYYLAYKALETGAGINLNAVSTTAEKLHRYQRDKIEEAFGHNVFDQYGCGEVQSIAFECKGHKGLHVASEHVILEIVDDHGQKNNRGDIIITDLENYAMPIIRYRNGDQAQWSAETCNCGRSLPLLKGIEGRIYDFIETPDGRKVHAGCIDQIFLDMDLGGKYSVREFRILQERIDTLKVEFVTGSSIPEKDRKTLKKHINRYLGDISIEIACVNSIPATRRGKKIFVLSLQNKDKWSGN